MFIDLKDVPEDGQVVDRVVPRESVRLPDDSFAYESDLGLSGRLEETLEGESRAFRFKGKLAGSLDVLCARCLEHFSVNLDEPLDLLYLSQSDNVERGAASDEDGHALAPNELAVAFYRDDQIDLSQLILEQTLLSLPMKPLCRPDCKGLCPECGTNRNESPCDCSNEENDPRWDGLKALLGS